MQPARGSGAGPGNVAAVLGDLRFVQNNIQQEPHLAYQIYPHKNLLDYCIPKSLENQPGNQENFELLHSYNIKRPKTPKIVENVKSVETEPFLKGWEKKNVLAQMPRRTLK
jgi:hypothetical protein